MESSLEYLRRLSDSGLIHESVLAELQADATLTGLSPKPLADELTRRQLITKYQARTLLRPGATTFDFADYRVIGRHTGGFRIGIFQAIHRAKGQRVELDRLATGASLSMTELPTIEHPNLVSCRSLFEERGRTFVVHDPSTGRPLAERLDDAFTPGEASEIVRQVAAGAWALHRHGIVHGMICPEAVLIDGGTARLIWRPGWSLNGQDKISVRIRSLLKARHSPAIRDERSQAPNASPSAKSDVYALGLLLDRLLADVAARPHFLNELIATLTGAADRRFEHAGPVEALLGKEMVPPSIQIRLEETTSKRPADHRPTRQIRRVNRVGMAIATAAAILSLLGGWLGWRQFRDRPRDLAPPVASLPEVSHDTRAANVAGSDAESDGAEPPPGMAALRDDRRRDASIHRLAGPSNVDRSGGPSDDGVSLWASPTSGNPIELRHLPSEAQLYLHMRPSEILADDQARLTLDALGPKFQAFRSEWKSAFGMDWSQIRELTVAVSPRDATFPDVCFVVQPHNHDGLPAQWNEVPTIDEGSGSVGNALVHRLDDRAVWDSGDGIVFGNESTVRQLALDRDKPTILPRELGQLRQTTDDEHLLSVILSPRFLSNQGDRLVSPQFTSLRNGVLEALGDQTRGCSLGLHIHGGTFYGEFRFASDATEGAATHGQRFRSFLTKLPEQMETALADLPSLDAYWRRIALRSVRMVEFFENNLRMQSEGRTVVVNVSLPAQAAHNLVLATELVTASLNDVAPTADPPTMARRSMKEILGLPIRIEIPQQSIEMALQHVREQVGRRLNSTDSIEIELDGPALQAEGITRNQQVRDFRRDNVALSDLLTGLVMVANPVPAESPSHSDQKLVWVVSNELDRVGKRIILITTRTAADKNGHSLPSAFLAK